MPRIGKRKRPLRNAAANVGGLAGLASHLLSESMQEGQTIAYVRILGYRTVGIEIPHPPYDEDDLKMLELSEVVSMLKKRLKDYKAGQFDAIIQRIGDVHWERLIDSAKRRLAKKEFVGLIGDVIRGLSEAAGDGSEQPTELQKLLVRFANIIKA